MRLPVFDKVGILLLILLLNGCRPVGQFLEVLVNSSQQINARMAGNAPALPTHPLYVLEVYQNDELVIVDPATWQVMRRAPLLNENSWDFTRDPLGRIWIGYGATPGMETRVLVQAPDGRWLKTLSTCITPYLPIHFAAGRAFIPCLQTGFYAAVVVVDLASLEIVQQVDIRIPDDSFLLVATGGDENYFVLAGGGEVSNRIVLLNTHTLATLAPLPIPNSHPVTILDHQGRFFLLNSVAELAIREGWSDPLPNGRPDLLIIDTDPTLAFTVHEMVAPGAVWGEIAGDTLYAYHDAQRIGLNPNPFRAVSQLNLVTNEAKLWSLPDNWNAGDIAIVNEEILLTHNDSRNPEKSGLFRFDPATGELILLVNIHGAYRILPPAE